MRMKYIAHALVSDSILFFFILEYFFEGECIVTSNPYTTTCCWDLLGMECYSSIVTGAYHCHRSGDVIGWSAVIILLWCIMKFAFCCFLMAVNLKVTNN